MALPKFETDIAHVSKLDDYPNDVGGLSANELKAVFDQAGQDIQRYINESLVPEAERAIEAAALGVGGGGDLDGGKLLAGSVTTDKIADKSVTAEKLADGAVDSSAIADNAVGEDKIPAASIGGDKLKEKTINSNHLAAESVISTAIFPGAVVESKIGTGAVTESKIAGGAVSREKLAADAKCASVDNISVPTDAWAADGTLDTHPFAAKISIDGVSAQHSAMVIFSPSSGEGMAPVSRTEEGSVIIYAESIPDKDVNILSIILIPVGAISNVSGDYPVYAGTYSVTPAAGEQTLDTDNKVLLSDITIEKIPVAEVSNEAGGTTISIA